MSQPVEIPRHVDDPPTLLLWRIDDLVPVVLMLAFGILSDQLLVFLVGGILLVRIYGRFRDSRPDGYALHWAYWIGLLHLRARTAPNPFIRNFLDMAEDMFPVIEIDAGRSVEFILNRGVSLRLGEGTG